jgi:hypothetical protein
MNNKLQINLFSCSSRAYRFPFTLKMVNEISNIKNLDKIKVCIHGEKDIIETWKAFFQKNGHNFELELIEYRNLNYLNRVYRAQETDFKYSCKLDDDVLISRHVLDYMIDNLSAINPKNPIIAPILSNGMPSVELFIQEFLNEEDLKIAHQLLLNGSVQENLWGLDYSEINTKIRSMREWNGREYWDFVANCNTGWETRPVPWYHFMVRGVHPARFSFEYNMFIASKIVQYKDKFFNKNEYSFETYDTSYFTNNMFIAETKFWKDTVGMFYDEWDEGQLTLKMKIDKSSVLYVKNGFGVHMAYGMTHGQKIIEENYINNL